MMEYKEVSLDSFKPTGIGLMQARLSYPTCKPRWGVFPINTKHTDVFYYRTYVKGEALCARIIAQGRSFKTDKLQERIPSELKSLIGKTLIAAIGVDEVEL